MSLQIRHQALWWITVLGVLALCSTLVIILQLGPTKAFVGQIKPGLHSIILLLGGLSFFLAESPAKELVDTLDKIQSTKDVQDNRFADFVGKLVLAKKRAMSLQDLLSFGRNFILVIAAALGQSVVFSNIPSTWAWWLVTAAYTAMFGTFIGTMLVRRWRMKAEDLREHIRVFSIRKSQEHEQARSFLTALAGKYESPSDAPTLEIVSILRRQSGGEDRQ